MGIMGGNSALVAGLFAFGLVLLALLALWSLCAVLGALCAVLCAWCVAHGVACACGLIFSLVLRFWRCGVCSCVGACGFVPCGAFLWLSHGLPFVALALGKARTDKAYPTPII